MTATPATPRLKKLLMGLMTTVLTLALLLIAGEIYFRQHYALLNETSVGKGTGSEYFVFDELLGWKGKPLVAGLHSSGAVISHNEYGFRDTPWNLDTAKRRVLMLGDSNLWGYGVEDNEYPAALLNRTTPDIRWFNAGMNGYGTDQEYLTFKWLKPLVKPDWTVLAFCDNDRGDNTSKRVRGYDKPFFQVQGDNLILKNSPVPKPQDDSNRQNPFSIRAFQKTHSRFVFQLAHLFEQWQGRDRVSRVQKSAQESEELSGDPTHLLIRQLFREADEHLLVVAINNDPALAEFCASQKIPFLDLSKTPASQPGPHVYPSGPPKHSHWTPEGTRIAAEEIAQAILTCLQNSGCGSVHQE
ncbi:MAG: SGNH/GDSL hydrolase family protein [Lentisphaerota bacterium]